MKPYISVAIPAYHEEGYIEACLLDLEHQKYSKPYEVIIGLTPGQDNTEEVIKKFCSTRKLEVRIIYERQRGIAKARQRAFQSCMGKIIASADADTKYPPKWLRIIDDTFHANPGVSLVYGRALLKDSSQKISSISLYLNRFINDLYTRLGQPLGVHNVVGSNFAVRRSIFQKVGGFDTSLKALEEHELASRIKREGKVLFNPKLNVYTSSRRFTKQGMLKTYSYFLRNYFKGLVLGKDMEPFEEVR